MDPYQRRVLPDEVSFSKLSANSSAWGVMRKSSTCTWVRVLPPQEGEDNNRLNEDIRRGSDTVAQKPTSTIGAVSDFGACSYPLAIRAARKLLGRIQSIIYHLAS